MATEKKGSPVLMPDRMGLRESKINDWVVDLPMTMTLEEAMEPSYWAHVAEQMVPGDHIIVRAEDGSWVAYLIVYYCERNYAKVILDRCVKLEADTTAPTSSVKHRVEWKGPRLKYCVIRTADSALLKSDISRKDEASAWMRDHEATLART